MLSTNHLAQLMTVICIAARLGDVLTTKLATHNLVAESNVIAKTLGWKYICLTVLIGLVPLVDLPLGAALATLSLLVSLSNGAKVLLLRLFGDVAYKKLIVEHLLKRGFFLTWVLLSLPAFFCFALGLVIFLALEGASSNPIAEGVTVGFFLYPIVALVHYSIFLVRLRSEGRALAEKLCAGGTEPPATSKPRARAVSMKR